MEEKKNTEIAIVADWPQVKAVVFNGDDALASRWVRSFKMNGSPAVDPKTGALIRPVALGDRRWRVRGYQFESRDAKDLIRRIQAVPMPSPAERIRAEQEKDAQKGQAA